MTVVDGVNRAFAFGFSIGGLVTLAMIRIDAPELATALTVSSIVVAWLYVAANEAPT